MKKITVFASAKINLYLDVLAPRADGYHDIESVMQTVSLRDTVELELTDGETTISVADAPVPEDKSNIACKAADAFFKETGLSGGVKIRLRKNIPVSSGLGGGSADGAAVLRGLNELCGNPLSYDRLVAVGAAIGADIPFCIKGGCALCRGVGEQLEQLAPMTPYPVVIARGGSGVSTPEAYKLLDLKYGESLGSPSGDIRRLIGAIESDSADALSKGLYNIFEAVILPRHREAAMYRQTLLDCGARSALMSGSGPAVFGIFANDAEAQSACEKLQVLGAKAFLCHTEYPSL